MTRPGRLVTAIGRRATPIRVVGGTLIVAVSVWSGIALAAYSQSLADLEPPEVESVVVAAFMDPDPNGDPFTVDALRVASSSTGMDVAGSGAFELDLSAQVSGDGLSSSSGRIGSSFIIGGKLGDAIHQCEDAEIERIVFDALAPGQQEAVLASIEDQLVKLQTMRGIRSDEQSSEGIRARAHNMSFIVLQGGVSDGAQWEQSIADRLRKVPIDSADRLPATQSQVGTQWEATCDVAPDLIATTTWGVEFALPAIGLAAPIEWGGSRAREKDAASGAPGIAVESESSLTWRVSSTDMDRVSVAEGPTAQDWWTESERTAVVESVGALTPDSDVLLSSTDSSDQSSEVSTATAYLSPSRYLLRYSSSFFRETQSLALFASGALFSLAATISIALFKTFIRAWPLRAPKP